MKSLHASPFPDYVALNEVFDDQQKKLIARVRDLVSEEFMPEIAKSYDEAQFLDKIPKVLGEQGLIGANLGIGGQRPLDEISYGLVMRELERCDSALRSFVSVQGSLVMFPIQKYGSSDQKEEWLSQLASGEAIGGFALTEPQGGSDPSSMLTFAELKDDSWVINGEKRWVTNGCSADVILVWAKTNEGVRCFLCPKVTRGLTTKLMTGKLSLRASETAELALDNVVLPKDAILPEAKGIGRALHCLNQARYGIIWGVLGAAEACFDEVVSYSQNRQLFKKNLSAFQLVQGKLADMCLKITHGQLLALRLGQLKNQDRLEPGQVSLGKQGNVSAALEIARTCRDILGANGILLEYCTMRHMNNLETVYSYEGTHDIHRLVVGQQITGTAAFQ